jgi:uncharacterized protein (TIGR02145 family)
MSRVLLFSLFLVLITIFSCGPAKVIASNKGGNLFKRQDIKPGFIENKGQIIDQNNKLNPAVLYLLNTPGMNVQLRKGGFSYDLYHPTPNPSPKREGELVTRNTSRFNFQLSIIKYNRIDIDLVNANPNPTITTSAPSSDYLNFYTTGTPVDGVTSVRSYIAVTYKDIYPGIDLQFITGEERPFEYNFILQPGADINLIKLKVYGPEKIKSYKEGLRCETTLGEVDETIPVCYYRMNDVNVAVKGRFNRIAEHLYGFATDQAIPAGAVLLIDPVPTRRWGTYFGGGQTGLGGCATDTEGNCIVAGSTSATTNIATAGAYQGTLNGINNAFVIKFFPDGQRQWGTYYGGTGGEVVRDCTVDRFDNIIFVGGTGSTTNIASPEAYQTVLNGVSDGMLIKFTPGGQRIWGTYYGGHEVSPWGTEELNWCAADTNGNIYVCGQTDAPDYIASPGAFQTTLGGKSDAFLVKFNANGQRLWGTYYGGSNIDQEGGCAVTKNGFVYLSGNTISPDNIATTGSFMPVYNGSQKSFLAAFDTGGQRLWGTYYAGEFTDWNSGCTADTGSNVYIYGATASSTNIATPGAYQQTMNGGSAYIGKFNSNGQRIWGTYYGLNGGATIYGATLDDSSNLLICGMTSGQDTIIASPGAFQPQYRGGNDAFLGKLSSTGSHRFWSSYYGGRSQDVSFHCATYNNGNIYLSGSTWSGNNSNSDTSLCTRMLSSNYIATPGSLQTELMGISPNAFLVKFTDCHSPDTALQINGPTSICANSSGMIYSINQIAGATDYHWCVSNNLTIVSGQHTTIITLDVGSNTGTDTISVYGINSCDNGFPKMIIIRVKPAGAIPIITGPNNTCAGTGKVYLTDSGKTNYQWSISGGGVITSGGSTTDNTVTVTWNVPGNQHVFVNYTDTGGCTSLNPTDYPVLVTASPIVSVSISTPANNICSGTQVIYIAAASNGGGNPVYQWQVNGINTGTNSTTLTYTPVNNDLVTCILTSSITDCIMNNPDTSNVITMVINPNLPVSVSVSTSQNPVCAGSSVTFTASLTNGGTSPAYQWKVNGTGVGANSATYSYIPNNGDIITCVVTSNATCITGNPATSNAITMIVNPNLAVSMTISASVNPFCLGSSVTFTGAPVNGGLSPSFQWQVNGLNVGTNSPTYSYNPANGDVVLCIMTSSAQCTAGNPATSNTITMIENNSQPAGVSIVVSSNPFCPGSSVTFTATPINGGSTPAYQWKVNGINAGTNSHTFVYNPANDDSVRCVMTSNLGCVTGNPASSAEILMSGTLAPIVTFTSCFDTLTTVNAQPIKLKGGIPPGGVYSGPGVNSLTGIFTPSIAGTGTKTIMYTYTNAAMCSASKNLHIIVQAAPAFSCGNNFTDIRDNSVYPTVQIGSQCWLAANLNFGTIIVSTQDQRDNCVSEKYCYNDNPVNCTSQGGLYQWDEMMQYDNTPALQRFCPPGWHIPTENDWNTLFANYINNGFAGNPLKYSGYSGFNALLSGVNYFNKSWNNKGFAVFFWSSTSHSPTQAWAHGMNEVDPSVAVYPASKANAFSVRCIKD